MNHPPAIEVDSVSHFYGQRAALRGVSFTVERGEIFALLGPNGGGKTTLFRLLSTLIPLQQGRATVLGSDVRAARTEVRRQLGVVFQAPSLDRKLTVAENLRHQAALYGLAREETRRRVQELLARFGLQPRAGELVETLSGGLRRRVELAKGLIHRPRLLLMDEPSTGLDPGVRSELWSYLARLRKEDGVTVALTTHLLEEADKADRIAILDAGHLVALDRPESLRTALGGEAITIETAEAEHLAAAIRSKFDIEARVVDGTVRLELSEGHRWISRLVESFPGRIDSILVGKPTLEDVFISKTGHRFWREQP